MALVSWLQFHFVAQSESEAKIKINLGKSQSLYRAYGPPLLRISDCEKSKSSICKFSMTFLEIHR